MAEGITRITEAVRRVPCWMPGPRMLTISGVAYLIPNDEVKATAESMCRRLFADYPKRELERLDVVHELFIRTFGGRIYLAPIDEDKLQNILDVGTGTGSCR